MKTKIKHLIIVLIIFPLIYIGISLTPLAQDLFVKGNNENYVLFWSLIIIVHWLTFYLVYRFLRNGKQSLKDIGYNLNRKQTSILIASYLTLGLLVFGFTELSLNYVEIDSEKLAKLPNFFPKTTIHRLFFILSVFTAGFCEEVIYRGFAITKLKELGLNKWIALIPSGISFVFIHGIIGFSQFWMYFIPAILFGLIYILSKRLLPGIIIHLLYNLTAMMAVFQAINNN